ncbi:MAG TPA: hypothetical protein VKE74_27290 [Gemmataceae bacterium]|nr:hypothetical protein [Gemmataceae bacterium]
MSGEGAEDGGRGRFPGRYIVVGMLVFVVLFLAVGLVLAYRLTPAAERFHEEAPASRR